jgi:hypothetical protein
LPYPSLLGGLSEFRGLCPTRRSNSATRSSIAPSCARSAAFSSDNNTMVRLRSATWARNSPSSARSARSTADASANETAKGEVTVIERV